MPPSSHRLTSIGRVLEAAEDASPVDAVAAVSRELGLAFGAVSVSFLIADLSGRSIDDALVADTAERIARIRATDEAREGLGAFLDKRPAAWTQRS